MQPVAKQRLMKAEKVLEGEGSRLADLGIEYDDELLLVYKLEGNVSTTHGSPATVLQSAAVSLI